MLYKYLPSFIFKRLFGNRQKYGLKINYEDEDFKKWQQNYIRFYNDNQKKNVGYVVNHFGFKVMKNIDLSNKIVLEVGPGIIDHLRYTKRRPYQYILADINTDFLEESAKRLKRFGVKNIIKLQVGGASIPLEDNSVDVLLTFHQLEHIYELKKYLEELKRVLKPNGLLVGAVPTEGSITWGLGRFLTSRRYVSKRMDFNYDKIICWEHPNFVDKIKALLDLEFEKIKSIKKPLGFLPIDFNLSWSFIYKNSKR